MHFTEWVRKSSPLSIIGLKIRQTLTNCQKLFTDRKRQHLQQIPCNTFHHTLIMLLHYLGKLKKFKFAANIEQTANNMHWFLHAHILMDLTYFTYYLLTCYFRLRFLLNILFNNTQFYVKRSKCWQRPCTLGMWHCTISREDYSYSIRPDAGAPNSPDLNLVCYKT